MQNKYDNMTPFFLNLDVSSVTKKNKNKNKSDE